MDYLYNFHEITSIYFFNPGNPLIKEILVQIFFILSALSYKNLKPETYFKKINERAGE